MMGGFLIVWYWISVINNLKGYCLVFFVKFIVRFEMIEENDI